MSKLIKPIVLLVLCVHTVIYVFLPQPIEKSPVSYTNEPNSYDDFFIENVLNIPDKTPAKESDDIERNLQIVEVEEFYTKISYKELNSPYQILEKTFLPFRDAFVPSHSLDVLYIPPKA